MTVDIGPTPKAKRYELIRSCLVDGVTLHDVLGESRQPDIVAVRHKVWYIMHTEWGYTSFRIGDIWGANHTTIGHGIRRHKERLNASPSEHDDQTSDTQRQSSSNL